MITPRAAHSRFLRVVIAALAACSVTAAVGTASAAADFGLQSFTAEVTKSDGTTLETQAGAHPADATTSFMLNTDAGGNAEGNIKDIHVQLPPGFVGDPQATPKCSWDALNPPGGGAPQCSSDSQVGAATLFFNVSGSIVPEERGVYNMEPHNGSVADFGLQIFGLVIDARASVRTGGDYGLNVDLDNISEQLQLAGSTLTLWGVPADPSHDANRFAPGAFSPGASSSAPLTPFLSNPTLCGGPLTTTFSADSWQAPGHFVAASAVSPTPTGCDRLNFQPTITVQPTAARSDTPTGLSVDVHVPQNDNPNGLATSTLKKAIVTLPGGVTVSPSAADGLGACSPDQIGLANASESSCPDASKIGTVEVDTPLLPDPLKGAVYLAQQNNNPFGSLLAIYVTAEADGVLVKLAGHVVPDPVTGQLTTTFDNNPQLPFTDFKLTFFGGPRAALATPESCGTFTTTSSLTPWGGTAAASPSDSFSITGCGDPSQFAPSFQAGTTNPAGGAFSPFVLSFSRSDSDQQFSNLTATLPPGLVAKIAGVPLCSNESANAGTCPAGSQVGTVETGAGPGPTPFFLPGKVYLTGPYKGGPYGLAVVVPAIAGPFNLGTVVVRQALFIDPTDAHVTVISDPFPTILQGIPLQLRRVDVTLNRSSFMVNPTSCSPMQITATLNSTQGRSAPLSSPFQVGDCQNLAFSPKLHIALSGKGRTTSGTHPTLTATLTQALGQANIHSARVTLPLSLALDPNNSQHVCSHDVAQAVHGGAVGCPANTIVGTATADTPLLDQPLTGEVYLVQGIRFNQQHQAIRTLPSLLVALRGQIALDLRAQTSVDGASRLVTTFGTIPDAAVSSFKLTINGGPNGLLVITGRGENICKAAQTAHATFGAQSGTVERLAANMSKPCRAASTTHKRHTRRNRAGILIRRGQP